MHIYWFRGALALVLSTSAAAAQGIPFTDTNSVQPNMSTNGPAGTYVIHKEQSSVDANGNATVTKQSFTKSQTYSSGNGALKAHTVIQTSGPTTTLVPIPLVPTNPQEITK